MEGYFPRRKRGSKIETGTFILSGTYNKINLILSVIPLALTILNLFRAKLSCIFRSVFSKWGVVNFIFGQIATLPFQFRFHVVPLCVYRESRVSGFFCGNLIVQTQKQSNKREKKRNKENSESGKTI